MTTRDVARLTAFKDDYPRCFRRGVLSVVDRQNRDEPLVTLEAVREKFTEAEWIRLDLFVSDHALPLEGYYPCDVERFLKGIE